MIPFRLSKGDWGTSLSPQPPVCARVDSIFGFPLRKAVIGGNCRNRGRGMRLTTVHSRAFFGFFRPISRSPDVSPPKRPGSALPRSVLVDAAALASYEKNARVVCATDATIDERHLLLSLPPHGTRVVTSKIDVTEIETLGQGRYLGLVHPRKTRRAGTTISAPRAGKSQSSRIPRHPAN